MDQLERVSTAPPAAPPLGGASSFFAEYFWFFVKNLIGYIFLALCAVLGPLPGPGGIFFFLIGFGLISVPGKRRLISRVFRGRRFQIHTLQVHLAAIGAGALAGTAAMWWLVWRSGARLNLNALTPVQSRLVYSAAMAAMWLVIEALLRFFNWLVGIFPKARRAVRPWLRHRGIDLLPPRIRKRVPKPDGTFGWSRAETNELLRLHQRHRDRASYAWTIVKPWLRRAIGLGITIAIFIWMLKPVVLRWDEVAPRVRAIDWKLFVAASAMFAAFLLIFRVVSWRTILAGFNHRLPLAPATRIWSTSELARYLPGVIWQVVGRVYLVKPYGVSGTVCSTSQILELVVFLLANVLVALSCLLWFGTKMDPAARNYLYLAMAVVPMLMLLLHPRVFYTLLTRYMTWRGKQLPARRVRGKTLTLLAVWAILGLVWQGLALWLLTHTPLQLPIQKWWVVAGAYCLAWCAGFIAFWAPGGLGVREFVFVMAMMFALPTPVRENFGDEKVLRAFLAFLGILLRLWATAGELLLAIVAYLADYRGAMGRPDAPGRVPFATEVEQV